MTLQQELDKHGITITPAFTGEYIRFEAQFFKGLDLGNGLLWANFGIWGKSNTTWTAAGVGITPEQQGSINTALAEIEAKRREYWEVVATQAQAMWDDASDRGTHPYLEKKKLSSLHGTRIWMNEEGFPVLLVPMRDKSGKLWNVTRIFSKEFTDEKTGEKRGNKFVLKGGRKEGLFHALSGGVPNSSLIFAEGFATGASLQEAFPESAVIVCFDAGNLGAVAEAFESVEATRIWAGDEDCYKPDKGNAGREAAQACAKEYGGETRFPRFKNTSTCPTDWNDLHVLEGLAAVKDQILNPPPPDQGASDGGQGGLTPLPGGMTAGKHQQAATALVAFFGERIRKQGEDLFVYTGTHWQWVDIGGTHKIKQSLQTLMGQKATAPQLGSAYALFVIAVKPVPEGVDLFMPPQWAANFRNGTLHVVKRDRKHTLEFRPHTPGDWMTNCLPYDYEVEPTSTNPEFTAMLGRLFAGDKDEAQKIRALRQMYGACLIPAFPHLFMLWGPPGTGKSSVIILASRLMTKANTCSVDPSEFDSANMASMVGKLVNMDTDIEVNTKICEKQIKKILDRTTFNIKRKYLENIEAPIPAVHIFGGNNIPKTLDGASRAHDRRWTFLHFQKVLTQGDYDLDYVSYCFDQGPGGILNFALEGLRDLLASGGHFLNPDSGKEKMADWQLQTDVVGQFLMDVDQGRVLDNNTVLKRGPERRVKQSQLWTIFKAWHLEVHSKPAYISRNSLYSQLRDRGYPSGLLNGYDCFNGIGVAEARHADH